MNSVPKEIMDMLHELIKEKKQLESELKRIRELLEKLKQDDAEEI